MVEDITLRLVHGLVVALCAGSAWSSRAIALVAPYPVPLEAVLGAEVAVLDALLQTCRALQRPGVVLAVRAQALLFGRWFGGHFDGDSGLPVGQRGRRTRFRVVKVEALLGNRQEHTSRLAGDWVPAC